MSQPSQSQPGPPGPRPPMPAELAQRLAISSEDKNGTISPLPGPPPLRRTKSLQASHDVCVEAFNAFDLDKDGNLDLEEFKRLIAFPELQADTRPKLSEADIVSSFHSIDTANTNKISYEEFYNWYVRTERESDNLDNKSEVKSQLKSIRTNLKDNSFIDNLRTFGMAQTYYCQICFEHNPSGTTNHIKLANCGHKFCEDCFTGFLTSEITRNNVYLECFADNPTTETDAKKSDSVCHQPIIHSDVVKTLKHSENKELLDKYLLFKERKDDPEQRECSKCGHAQHGDPNKPSMVCENAACGHKYCFTHGDSHPDKTCAQFNRAHQAELKKTEATLSKDCKNCPGCDAPILKAGGCNHMKCPHCHCDFCWLCGCKVDSGVFPTHFKIDPRNPGNKCAGRQMDDETAGFTNLHGWKLGLFLTLTIPLMLIIFAVGTPIALAFSILLQLLCGCCLCAANEEEPTYEEVLGIFCGMGYACAACLLCPVIALWGCVLGCCGVFPQEVTDGPAELRADQMTWGSEANQKTHETGDTKDNDSDGGVSITIRP